MEILVCVKQVPDTTEIKIDPVTNTLIRNGVPSIVNPFDGYALEAAARIKDKHPDTRIIVLSMGPEQAKNALKECLEMLYDQGYQIIHICTAPDDDYDRTVEIQKFAADHRIPLSLERVTVEQIRV